MAKVFVANAGMEKGETSRLLAAFMDGMEEAGGKVDVQQIKRLKISPCIGDFHCWYTSPGRCRIKDDMQALYPKLREAEVLVLATPIYLPLPGEMQNFLNRLVPLVEPVLRAMEGETQARLREEVRLKKLVLLSTSGWWEIENLSSAVHIAKDLAFKVGIEYAGSVLRPHAFMLEEMATKRNEVLNAAKRAGNELMSTGTISKGTQADISQPLASQEEVRTFYAAMLSKVG